MSTDDFQFQLQPDRLRQARARAGLTLQALSERLAAQGCVLTRAALSKYELGKSLPRQSTLLAIARALAIPPSYLFQPETVQIRWLAFRKHARLSKARQEQVRAEIADVVARQVVLEELRHPGVPRSFPRAERASSPADAERAAEAVRRTWKLGEAAIESVVRTLEDHAGVVACPAGQVPDFDGMAGWANERHAVLVSRRDASLDRRRYNFAHELGHLVMNWPGATEKQQEEFAHRFAAAFLVPAVVARRELGGSRRTLGTQELGLLKEKYGLSMQAWVRRALDLEIVGRSTYERLCVDFSRRGWRKEEPVRFEGNEEPMRLKLLATRALAEGIITPARAEELCPGSTEALPEAARRRAVELRRIPAEEQSRLLALAAEAAAADYAEGSPLRDFEAYGDDDLA
ncbi:MAG TPA: XRE family transcriptional regulator [Anaeromyxobacteraceae bacterium]|nr:XRE family transcriptional regulator [Anaeromyxobacteraceae bacterium]